KEQFSLKCPACQKGIIEIIKTEYDLPDQDKMLILKFECNNCNFHKNDIIPLTTRIEPGISSLKVTNEIDLKSKVYRSPTGKLEIPELEVIVTPGPRAQFYFTNIEGILMRFEDAVNIYEKNLDKNDPEKIEVGKILKDLKKAMRGELNFTVKLTDESGGSYIIPEDKSKYTFEKIDLEHNNMKG
ncbi:MAG: ZPR1 zinc finger domain-containing protein, partial [Candidatus Lokiarchaeota archaeon]